MAAKTYCKQHEKFDDCAEKVAKALPKAAPEVAARLDRLAARQKAGFGFKTKTPQDAMAVAEKKAPALPKQRVGKRHGPGGGNVGDDGIHHLEGVSRVKTSPETRANGSLVPLEIGRRKMDGTPKIGRGDDSVSSKVSEAHKAGRSGRSKPVGSSKVREQIGKALDDPFEINKRQNRDTSFGRDFTGAMFPGVHAAIAGKPNHKLKAAGYELGGSFAGGMVGLPTAGAAIGTHVASTKGHYRKLPAKKK